MIYEWRCKACGAVVEVNRRVADHELGPDETESRHDGCDSAAFRRILSVPKRVVVPENEDQYW